MWAEAIALEINSLIKLDCLEFKSQVAGGHVVNTDQATHDSTIMATSVRLLHLIAHANALDILCGDVSNAFVNAHTKKLTYCRAGPEFGDYYQEGFVWFKIFR
jgi:hypothetical protein